MATMSDRRASGPPCVESALESLQPIKDLAKNWDIDIAACLEEYLQDLIGDLTEEERKNLPQPTETLNFSQAALVLQNSSCVYSRKVEYLYKLVNQVHEEIIASAGARDSASGKKTTRKSSGDTEIEAFNEFDQNVDFLLLDDVLPTDDTGAKINLNEDKNQEGNGRESGVSFATMGTRLSLGATLGGASRLDPSAMSSTGHGVTHNLVAGSLDAGGLRLIDGRCDVGEDGIMILPGAGGSAEGKLRRGSLFSSFSPRASVGGGPADKEAVDFGGVGDDNYDDHDDGGFHFADDYEPLDENQHENEHVTQENQKRQCTPNRPTSAKATTSTKEQKIDPWTLLDPHSHESSNMKIRPLRVAKTTKLPSAVSTTPSEVVTGASTKSSKQRKKNAPLSQRHPRKEYQSFASAIFKAQLSCERNNKSDSEAFDDLDNISSRLPQVPMRGLVYGDEFLYIARAVTKQKNALRREELKKRAAEEETVPEPNFAFPEDDDDGYAAPDFGGGDDASFGFDGEDEGVGNTEDDPMENMMNSTNGGGQTFEELCRAHIQAFAKGAEAFARETGLSRRVGNWHDRLAPILEEEERRPEFDIHAYTERVVSAIVDKADEDCGSVVADFDEVTQNCPRYEVCRLFLATLSLANSRNVNLEFDQELSQFRIEVVNRHITNPMQSYLAPSLAEE